MIEKRKDSDNIGLVSFDGAHNLKVIPGDIVTITASPNVFKMIRLEESSVYEILKKKIVYKDVDSTANQ
jgi:NAD+ kinase